MSLRGNRIGARIARRILAVVSVALLVGSTLLAVSAWRAERSQIQSAITGFSAAFAAPLTESIWLVDMPLVRSQLQAMTQIKGLGGVALTTFTGQQIEFGKVASKALPWGLEGVSTLRIPLAYKGHPVGTLTLVPDNQVLYGAVLQHLKQILLEQLLILILGAVALTWVLGQEVKKPLEKIAKHLAHWSAAGSVSVLEFEVAAQASDELETLVGTINRMNADLVAHLGAEDSLKAELARSRDQFAELADSRGQSLSYHEKLQQQALAMSTALINIPQHLIESQLKRSLSDIAREGYLDFVGLLRAQGDQGVALLTFCESDQCGLPAARVSAMQADFGYWARRSSASLDRLDGLDAVLGQASDGHVADPRDAFLGLGLGSVIIVALQMRGSHHGALVFGRQAQSPVWSERELIFFELLGQIVASALAQIGALEQLADTHHALQEANAELLRISSTDPLTGIANRRGFDQARTRELRRARRTSSVFSLILLDVDHFKAYNDALGHVQGDVCLVAIASAINRAAHRPGDLAARLGGEEFALLLADTDLAGAQAVFEELRREIHKLALSHPASPVAPLVTLSAGIAVYDVKADQPFDALYAICDQALYRAKHSGRDGYAVAGS